MNRLSLAPQTLMEVPAAMQVRIARAAGLDRIGLRTIAGDPGAAPGMPCLIADDAQAAEARAALDGEGVAARELEYVTIAPATRVAACRAGIERGAALGTEVLLVACTDPDPARAADRIAALAALAAEYRHRLAVEFAPWCAVAKLDQAAAMARAAGQGAGVVIDAIHLARGGGSVARLAACDPALIAFAQLCDAPAAAPETMAEILRIARDERLDPGEGELDLGGLLAALPKGVPISLEVPNVARVAAIGALAHVRRVHAATARLFARLASSRPVGKNE